MAPSRLVSISSKSKTATDCATVGPQLTNNTAHSVTRYDRMIMLGPLGPRSFMPGREQLLANLDEGEFTEGHDPLSRSRAGHCQTATRLSPHEIVKFGTSICNNRRRSPDRRPWLRSSLSQRLARGCPALETCSSAPQ